MSFLYILLAVLGFGVLIFIHELGHFITARLCHVKIYEFAVGMGPKLLWYESKKSGITYSLRMLPFGGYVSMAGEDDDADEPNALPNKKPLARLLISAAGGLMNLLLGIILILTYVLATPIGTTTVAELAPEYDAIERPLEQRLLVGDDIIAVDGTRVHIAADLLYQVSRKGIEPVDVEIDRNGERLVIKDVRFPTYEAEGQTMGDAFFKVARGEKTFASVCHQTFYSGVNLVRMVFETIFDLVTGRYTVDAVSGPVGAAGVMSEVASISMISFIYLLAAISINLGLFNLLPIPALDGFRVLFVLIEIVFRRPVPRKIEQKINQVGLVVLLLLMLVITCKDVVKLF